MANKVGTAQDDVQGNENSLNNLSKGREVSGESDLTMTGSKSKRLIKRVNPLPALIVGVKHSQIGKYIPKDFFTNWCYDPVCYDFMDSPSALSLSSLVKNSPIK